MSEAATGPGFWRRFSARALTIVGVILVVVTILAGYLRWQVFDQKTFETTAEQLIADDVIRNRVADRTAEVLLDNVDVEQLIADKLPPDQQALAAPLAASFAVGASRFTEALYARPRFQDLWVAAASETQQQVEKILDDDRRLLKTVDGKLVLDLRPIVIQVGDQVAIIGRAASVIPPDRAVIKIVDADKLETAQDATALFKSIAPWIWVVALACFALAIWLAAGRRRIEIRAIAIGLIVAGFVVLIIRALAGRYLVNDVVPREEGKQAAQHAWDIITQLLADGAWSAILLGVVFLAGVIIAGPSRLGRRARDVLSPVFENRWLLYASLAGFLLLLAWWNPIAQTGRLLYMAVFAGLLVAGAEGLLHVVHREAAAEGTAKPPPPPTPPADATAG
jgi:hypothetical protein